MAVDQPTQATLPYVTEPGWDEVVLGRDLLSQYRELPRWRALFAGLAEGAQAAEDLFAGLVDGLLLQSATGATLDKWGAIVGEARGGLLDQDYRRFIGARILVNQSGGTTDDLIQIAQIITAPSSVRLITLPPASFTIEITRESPLSAEMVRRLLRTLDDARPGGVAMNVVEAVGAFFGFDGDPDALGYDAGGYARILS